MKYVQKNPVPVPASGPYAELAAGHMRHEGELYILIKRPNK